MKRILTIFSFISISWLTYAQSSQHVDLTIQSGHFANIRSLNFSSDGKWIASGGDDGMLKIWDISSGRLLASLVQRDASIQSIAFSPSSNYVATLTESGRLSIWNIRTSHVEYQTTITNGNAQSVFNKIEFTDNDDQLYALVGQQLYRVTTAQGKISSQRESSSPTVHFVYQKNSKSIKYLLADGGIIDGGNNQIKSTYSLSKTDKKLIDNGSINFKPRLSESSNTVAVIKGWKVEIINQSDEVSRHATIQGDYVDDRFSDLAFLPSKKLILASNTDSRVYAIDFSRKNKFKRLEKAHVDDLLTIAVSNDEALFATAGTDRSIIIWDAKTLKPLRTLFGKTYRTESVSFVPDHGQIVFGDELGYLKTIDIFDRNLGMKSRQLHKYPVTHIGYSENTFVSVAQDNYLKKSNLDFTHEEKTKVMHKFMPAYFFLNQFGFYKPYLYTLGSLSIDSDKSSSSPLGEYHFRWSDLKKVKQNSYAFTPKPIINVSTEAIDITSTVPAFINNHPNTHTNLITDYDQDELNNLGITSSWDCSLKIWDLEKQDLLATIIPFGNKTSRAIITPENYYLIDKKAFEGLNFKVGTKVFSAEQFDLKFNRPDKVLEKLGGFPAELISAYHKAYQKRLGKLGFTESSLDSAFHAPSLSASLPDGTLSSKQPTVTISINAYDSLYHLDRLNIWVNGVPQFGMQGKDLKNKNTQRFTDNITIELSDGKNTIELSVLNIRGVESYKEKIQVTYQPQTKIKPDLYLVCIGVSEYMNKNFNLNYAAKDSRDLVNYFKNAKQDYFNSIIVHSLNNETATTENIKALKEKLKNTRINDHVYVFFSGHGVLNKELDYFLATHDLNFSNPSQNGLLYEDFENIMDGIPARQKLVMVDACHSGEIDKEEVQVLESANHREFQEIKMTRSGDQTITAKTIGLSNSFELMKQQFVDLRKSTGATVISAAGGVEFAYEGVDGLRNGVFTHSVIQGLKEKKADLNGDGIVYLSELQNYVSQTVIKLTNGKQQPTSRIENLINDFRIR